MTLKEFALLLTNSFVEIEVFEWVNEKSQTLKVFKDDYEMFTESQYNSSLKPLFKRNVKWFGIGVEKIHVCVEPEK